MPKWVLLVATGGAFLLVPTGLGTSGVTCQIVPAKTVSPTNSRLWTHNHRGSFVATPEYVNSDGSMWLKAPWFAAGPRGRSKRGPRGVLHITGTRLDGVEARLRATTTQVWVEGYGGSGVWAAVITFPSEGCWNVKGRVQRTIHTFRLLVTKTE
jgi:hypothetical protein